MNVADMRKDYTQHGLLEGEAAAEPFAQFSAWFDQAVAGNVHEPNAMTVATVDPDGRPSARIVLLKGYDARGFVFYTNYESRKGRALEANPAAALVFFWQPLERQVRVEGDVARVAPEVSDAYFASRPLGARVGAWASAQSAEVPDRAYLEARRAQLEAELGTDPPRPPHWGGYQLRPQVVEFWQGRPDRLHDRLRYARGVGDTWRRGRLSP